MGFQQAATPPASPTRSSRIEAQSFNGPAERARYPIAGANLLFPAQLTAALAAGTIGAPSTATATRLFPTGTSGGLATDPDSPTISPFTTPIPRRSHSAKRSGASPTAASITSSRRIVEMPLGLGLCGTCCTTCTCTLDGIANQVGLCGNTLPSVSLTGISATGTTNPIVITATSSNTAILANPTVNYTSPNPTGSLTLNWAGGSGSVLITVKVTSTGCAPITRTANFALNRTCGPPTIDQHVSSGASRKTPARRT